MGKHYALLTVDGGERVYMPISAEEDEYVGLTRWVDQQVASRKRGIDKAREEARARVTRVTVCRPTSWHRAQAIAAGLDFDAGERPASGKARRRGR